MVHEEDGAYAKKRRGFIYRVLRTYVQDICGVSSYTTSGYAEGHRDVGDVYLEDGVRNKKHHAQVRPNCNKHLAENNILEADLLSLKNHEDSTLYVATILAARFEMDLSIGHKISWKTMLDST